MEQLLPILLLALVFYLLIFRPMRARQKELAALQELQNALQPGVRIMMASGIFGVVQSVSDDEVILEIAPNIDITIAKGAVASVETESSDPLLGD